MKQVFVFIHYSFFPTCILNSVTMRVDGTLVYWIAAFAICGMNYANIATVF